MQDTTTTREQQQQIERERDVALRELEQVRRARTAIACFVFNSLLLWYLVFDCFFSLFVWQEKAMLQQLQQDELAEQEREMQQQVR